VPKALDPQMKKHSAGFGVTAAAAAAAIVKAYVLSYL
jgi:hypothetical protein|tara:strand:- start:423 stop:533 length:111 start_codon:yes stop_codon:yes gene_type:complete